MGMCVQRLEMILCGCACSAPSEGILKETKKKGKAKSAKGRKQKKLATKLFCFTVNVLSVFCFILLHLVHLFITVSVPILYFFIHFRPTELDALVFGHLHSVLTRYLLDNSLSSIVRPNKNLDNFVVRILREFFQWLIKNLPFVWLTNISQGHSYPRKISTDKEKWDFFLLLL